MKTYLVVTIPDFLMPVGDGGYMPEDIIVYSDYGAAVDCLNAILERQGAEPVSVKKLEVPHCVRVKSGYVELWVCNTKHKMPF